MSETAADIAAETPAVPARQGADLDGFERLVYGRPRVDRIAEHDQCLKALDAMLFALREGHGFEGYGRPTAQECTRLASAVCALFADPQFTLTQVGFDFLMGNKCVLDTVFRASLYGGSDWAYHLIPDEQGASKFLALFDVRSNLDLDLESVFRTDPQATFGLWLSLIGYGQNVTKEAHERREHLLGMSDIFKDVFVQPIVWNALCSAYMHCSYASGPHKHDCKRLFHQLLANILDPVNEPLKPRNNERPKLLCVFEWWWSKHAMYRSYAHSIRQLRKEFTLVGCCAGRNTDDEARELFDEWIDFDANDMDVGTVAARIREIGPDMIYYPSVGMAVWVIAMASLRLAPIQIMGYGHPATSNSPVIDFGIIEEDCYVPASFAEKVITLPPNTVRPTEHEVVRVHHKPRKTDRVKIAIPAMQVKLTYPFVQALSQIQARAKEAGKEVELRFFCAAHGIGLLTLAKDLAAQLENVLCHEQQEYHEYTESMADCDLALFSFPFGGANSAYDCLSLGLPWVSLLGEQPHSMSDGSIAQRAGLPASVVTRSVEEYVNAVVKLVVDDDYRAAIAMLSDAVDKSKFYTADESGAFLDAFKCIYRTGQVEIVEAGEGFVVVAQ